LTRTPGRWRCRRGACGLCVVGARRVSRVSSPLVIPLRFALLCTTQPCHPAAASIAGSHPRAWISDQIRPHHAPQLTVTVQAAGCPILHFTPHAPMVRINLPCVPPPPHARVPALTINREPSPGASRRTLLLATGRLITGPTPANQADRAAASSRWGSSNR